MKLLFLIIASLFLVGNRASACTSAIVSAKRSSEGVPLLWKHRDSPFYDTRIEHITDGKYAYTAIVPNTEKYRRGVYAGINEKGLGVITTATYRLPTATPEEWEASPLKYPRKALPWIALRECATVDEFEEMIRHEKRYRGYDSNLGIADATGAVAYFEIWDLGYRRYDVSEREEGFDVRTNFSFVGDPDRRGSSERRYNLMMKQMEAHSGEFSPQDFIDYSRSYNSVKFGDVLATDNRYICQNHTVPRTSSVGSFVMICDGENPRLLVMNGHPVSSLAVPVYVKAGEKIPQCVHTNVMQRLSNDFKAKAYIKVGEKKSRLNKEVVRKVLKIKHPRIKMPATMPADIDAYNSKIDKLYAKRERLVRKALTKF